MGEELEAREAVRQAYEAYYRRLVAALYALTGDYSEAQDLVQEAYARALARPRQFLDVADPQAWLHTVAINLARTRWRRRRLFDTLVRSGRVPRPVESVPGVDPNRIALVAALQQLSRPTRETIVLHHLADMSVYEVAETLGVPVGTVKARLSRGRAMLATLLREYHDDGAGGPPGTGGSSGTRGHGDTAAGAGTRGKADAAGEPEADVRPGGAGARGRNGKRGTMARHTMPAGHQAARPGFADGLGAVAQPRPEVRHG